MRGEVDSIMIRARANILKYFFGRIWIKALKPKDSLVPESWHSVEVMKDVPGDVRNRPSVK